MALKLVKESEQQLQAHVQALHDNLKAIRATREQLNAVNVKDRKAAADQALCDATQAQMQTVQGEIDALRADAAYAAQPTPDVRAQEAKLQSLQQLLKKQTDTARAATLIRAKYSADMATLNAEISTRGQRQPQLLFNALREDCLASLAAEFLEKEQQFIAIHRKVFAAALAVDIIAMENHFGQFVKSGNIRDLLISRPDHEAFDPHPLLPEQAQAARKKYATDVASDAAALVQELLAVAD
jgi:hypothetical protein